MQGIVINKKINKYFRNKKNGLDRCEQNQLYLAFSCPFKLTKFSKKKLPIIFPGERNPLNQGDLVKYINEGVAKYPSDKMIWKPSMKMRSGWRYTLSFYLFHIIPALIYYLPERYLKLGKPANS